MSLEQHPEIEDSSSERDAALSLLEKTKSQIREAPTEEDATEIFKAATSELSKMSKVARSQRWEDYYYRIEAAFTNLLNQKKVSLNLREKLSGDEVGKDVLLQVIYNVWKNLSEADLNQMDIRKRKGILLFAEKTIADLCKLETATPERKNYDLLNEILLGLLRDLETRN